jgi:hypothetical protein
VLSLVIASLVAAQSLRVLRALFSVAGAEGAIAILISDRWFPTSFARGIPGESGR